MHQYTKIFRLSCIVMGMVALLVSAYYVFPLPGHDAIFFLPAAWFYANGEGFINPLVPLACETDPQGLCRYCFHLPLFPWVVGIMVKAYPTVRGLFLAAGLISIAKLLLFDKLWAGHSRNIKGHWLLYLLSIALLVAYSLPTEGRPEILSSFIILLIYYLFNEGEATKLSAPRTWALIFALGLLLACHLTAYYFTIVLVSVGLFVDRGAIKDKFVAAFAIASAPIAFGLLVIWLSPNGWDTVRGIVSHSPLSRRDEVSFIAGLSSWITFQSAPGIGLFLSIASYLYLTEASRRIRQNESPAEQKLATVAVVGAVILIALGIYRFVIVSPARMYDMAQFFAVCVIYIVSKRHFRSTTMTAVFALSLCVSLILPIRNFVLFIDYLADGKTYDQALTVMRDYASKEDKILGTHDMWVLCDDLGRFTEWQNEITDSPLFIQQARRPFSDLLKREGVLLADWRTTDIRRIASIRLTNRPQGYSFSVWRLRTPTHLKQQGEFAPAAQQHSVKVD